tara:strand:+ start:121 stop:693 length:573 start_codon:yes stop_codon:yes gene_type:complete
MHKIIISKGNRKVPYPNISLTPVKACANHQECKTSCYARKAYRQYPNVRKAWDNNLNIAETNPVNYFSQVNEFLTQKKPDFFRWHVAGDILNKAYLQGMISLANRHSDTKFLAFTKRYDLTYRSIPKNLSIVMSVWPGMPTPTQKLPRAYMQDGSETRVKNAFPCPGNCEGCGLCWYLHKIGKNVVFKKH